MITIEESERRRLVSNVRRALTEALAHGYAVTVSTVPHYPLAMGNYHLKVECRPSCHFISRERPYGIDVE